MKQTAKQEVREMLEHLPDSSTFEDIQYHVYVLDKIRRGKDDITNGKSYTSDQVRERLQKWLTP